MDRTTSHDEDIYAWAEQQAAALRRLAESRRDLPNELDLANVAEEIEDVGRSELRAAESMLELVLRHLIKLASAPEAPARRHWDTEARVHQRQFARLLAPSMASKIDLDEAWDLARARAGQALEAHGDALIEGVPEACPLDIAELSAPTFDLDTALARLRPAI